MAAKGTVPRFGAVNSRGTKDMALQKRPDHSACKQSTTLKYPHTSSNRMETVIRMARAKKLSVEVLERINGSRCPTANELYQPDGQYLSHGVERIRYLPPGLP